MVASFSYKDANNVQVNADSKMFHMNRERDFHKIFVSVYFL